MLERIPGNEECVSLAGRELYSVWQALCTAIDEKYDMERTWDNGGKRWVYELKYRRGGKTLCALYMKENRIGLMIIFGKDERTGVEAIRETLTGSVCKAYDEATTYHDGKWVMFEPVDTSDFDSYLKLLAIKRRPNRKPDANRADTNKRKEK